MTVDPYVIALPDQIVDPSTGRPTNDFLQWLIYDNRFKHDLWQETTDATGSIEGVTAAQYDAAYAVAAIEKLSAEIYENFIAAMQQSITPIYSVTSNYTTAGSAILICNNTSAITVTLNSAPGDGEKVTVKRRDALVTVSGMIDGMSQLIIGGQYESPTLVYTVDAGEWSII